MSNKENDLQKVISEIQNTLKDKDVENIKEQLSSKLDSASNIADLLQNGSVQEMLNSMLKNKNISNILQNPDLTGQLLESLKKGNNSELIDEVQNILKKKNNQ